MLPSRSNRANTTKNNATRQKKLSDQSQGEKTTADDILSSVLNANDILEQVLESEVLDDFNEESGFESNEKELTIPSISSVFSKAPTSISSASENIPRSSIISKQPTTLSVTHNQHKDKSTANEMSSEVQVMNPIQEFSSVMKDKLEVAVDNTMTDTIDFIEKADTTEFTLEQPKVASTANAANHQSSKVKTTLEDVYDKDTKSVVMYWYDLAEENHSNLNRGNLFLFGKTLNVNTFQQTVQSKISSSGEETTLKFESKDMNTASTCVIVKNLFRNVYFLPRKHRLKDFNDPTSVDLDSTVTIKEVFDEVKSQLNDNNIKKIMTKPVEMKYCFDRKFLLSNLQQQQTVPMKDSNDKTMKRKVPEGENEEQEAEITQDLNESKSIPLERQSLLDPINLCPSQTTYQQVRYPFEDVELPRNLVGRTFSAVFNTNASKLETFILDNKLSGPGWIMLKNLIPKTSSSSHTSWCSLEFELENSFNALTIYNRSSPQDLDPTIAPLFSSLSFHLTTAAQADSQNSNELILATIRYQSSVSVDFKNDIDVNVETFTFITPPHGKQFPALFTDSVTSNNNSYKKSAYMSPLGQIIITPDEKSLLAMFLDRICNLDPDILISHELHGWYLDLLAILTKKHKLDINLSKLGRLKKRTIPNIVGSMSLVDQGLGSGRLLVDTQVSAKEFWAGLKNYSFSSLVYEKLDKIKIVEVPPTITSNYYKTKDALLEQLKISIVNTKLYYQMAFALEALPLTKQLSELCGNLWQRSQRSSRAERVEYMLLREFVSHDYIPPEKLTKKEKEMYELEEKRQQFNENGDDDFEEELTTQSKSSSKRRRKAEYSGGTVLEPKKGYYDTWIAVLDFNSLYPSIIREYNICFTTLNHWSIKGTSDEELAAMLRESRDVDADDVNPSVPIVPGILPSVVALLIERRKDVKNSMKFCKANSSEALALDIRQKAYKLVANSMYGCLGFRSSRFYCRPLAALTTMKGRLALQNAADIANKKDGNVIYGDTDSIMLNTKTTNFQSAKQLAEIVKREINRRYRVLRIDEDAFMRSMLLLNKKKYASLKYVSDYPMSKVTSAMRIGFPKNYIQKVEPQDIILPNGSVSQIETLFLLNKDVKGLDQVRRDWAPISRSTSDQVLNILLSGESSDDIKLRISTFQSNLTEEIDQSKRPLQDFILTKQITRSPLEYSNAKDLPHVQVALAMLRQNLSVRSGDIIEYVIIKGDGPVASRAVMPTVFKQQQLPTFQGTKVEIDLQHYKEFQIFPPLNRLITDIANISTPELAQYLGLDSKSYTNTHAITHTSTRSDDFRSYLHSTNYDKFKEMPVLAISCPQCKTKYPFVGLACYKPAISKDKFPKIFQNLSKTPDQPSPTSMNENEETMATSSSSASIVIPPEAFKDYSHALSYLSSNPTINAKSLDRHTISGFLCPSPNCTIHMEVFNDFQKSASKDLKLKYAAQLCNAIDLFIRELSSNYYKGEQIFVDDSTVDSIISRDVIVNERYPKEKIISDYSVYNQYCYYQALVNYQGIEKQIEEENKYRQHDAKIRGEVKSNQSGIRDTHSTLPSLDLEFSQDLGKYVLNHVNDLLALNDYNYIEIDQLYQHLKINNH